MGFSSLVWIPAKPIVSVQIKLFLKASVSGLQIPFLIPRASGTFLGAPKPHYFRRVSQLYPAPHETAGRKEPPNFNQL
jgi:hypothetical protein